MRLLGRRFSGGELSDALHTMRSQSVRVAGFFEKYDVLLTPTLALPPVKLGALHPRHTMSGVEYAVLKGVVRLGAGGVLRRLGAVDKVVDDVFVFAPYTAVFNATGQPAMSVPLWWSDEGLPIGVQFVGRFADEATLFRLAGQMERAHPWAGRTPPVCKTSWADSDGQRRCSQKYARRLP
jgi:amidase